MSKNQMRTDDIKSHFNSLNVRFRSLRLFCSISHFLEDALKLSQIIVSNRVQPWKCNRFHALERVEQSFERDE
jgi:hypothetical protein